MATAATDAALRRLVVAVVAEEEEKDEKLVHEDKLPQWLASDRLCSIAHKRVNRQSVAQNRVSPDRIEMFRRDRVVAFVASVPMLKMRMMQLRRGQRGVYPLY